MRGWFLDRFVRYFLTLSLIGLSAPSVSLADAVSDYPIMFVTLVPNPRDFGTQAATFSNHLTGPTEAYRGGDLWIRYPDGSLRNLTEAAGFGGAGFQGASAIAVRDPSPHWDGTKVIFSMLVGAPSKRYELIDVRWQIYEITSFGPNQTPSITKIVAQPEEFNNISPVYGSDDSIIFVSDRPRDSSVMHTYPQRDEYESAASNSGLWKLNPSSGELVILDHAPSGDFNPIIDSFGRIIFSRWDHLQRDQQNVGASLGAYNYESETSGVKLASAAEKFPEPRSNKDPEYVSTVNLFTINQFFPWMMHQDGTDLETLNHVGRHEIGNYIERNFNDDPNVSEFYGQYTTGDNKNDFTIMLHIREDPLRPGTYLGTSCQEFGTHASGQIISLQGPPGMNPDRMLVTYLTHPDTSGAADSPSPNHSGLYRDPLPLANGALLAAHTSNTRQDENVGTSSSPSSLYDFRLKILQKSGEYYVPGASLTNGISKSVSFWSPDESISYAGPLWELMPVEVKPRARPPLTSLAVPAIEAKVMSDAGVSEAALRAYLKANNLALVVSRNLTTRDRNDKQQPTNLRVTGTDTQTLAAPGKVYDISFLQFFQGDLIRGYMNGNQEGRRVLAQPMHSIADGTNLPVAGGPAGSVAIADDGSMAAFVPAGRALSWQMTDVNGKAVVRERYWLTFQAGEIRVCASCHGVNTANQAGAAAPANEPLALAQLLAHWSKNPIPQPTPSDGNGGGGDGGSGDTPYRLSVSGKRAAGKKFALNVSGASAAENLALKAEIGGLECKTSKSLQLNGAATLKLRGRWPAIKGEINFTLLSVDQEELAASTVTLKSSTKKLIPRAQGCKRLLKALR